MLFPRVKKNLGRLTSSERLAMETVKFVGAALLAAGLSAAGTAGAKAADEGPNPQAISATTGAITILPATPAYRLRQAYRLR